MNDVPIDGAGSRQPVRITAHKARMAGGAGFATVIVLWVVAPYIGVERPPMTEFQDAVELAIGAAITGLAGFLGAYFRSNKVIRRPQ